MEPVLEVSHRPMSPGQCIKYRLRRAALVAVETEARATGTYWCLVCLRLECGGVKDTTLDRKEGRNGMSTGKHP